MNNCFIRIKNKNNATQLERNFALVQGKFKRKEGLKRSPQFEGENTPIGGGGNLAVRGRQYGDKPENREL